MTVQQRQLKALLFVCMCVLVSFIPRKGHANSANIVWGDKVDFLNPKVKI